jgi:hypothetical protein
MAEASPTLATIYDSWKRYRNHLKEALAPLTAEQLHLYFGVGLTGTAGASACSCSPPAATN